LMRRFDNPDDYRAHADECFRLAELSLDPKNKERWLALAAEWLNIAETSPNAAKQTRQAG